MLATETRVEQHPTAARALEWARGWYPTGEHTVTGVTDARAQVLVEIDGDVRIVHYENLDADGPKCEICGRSLGREKLA